MQLGCISLYDRDVPATFKLYEAAFGLAKRFTHESCDYRYELKTGNTALAFFSRGLMQQLGKYLQAATPSLALKLRCARPWAEPAHIRYGFNSCLRTSHSR